MNAKSTYLMQKCSDCFFIHPPLDDSWKNIYRVYKSQAFSLNYVQFNFFYKLKQN